MKPFLLAILLTATVLFGQNSTLRGVVTDESGAVVPGARITLTGPGGAKSANSDSTGTYTISGLATGDYTAQASAPQLAQRPVKVTVRTGTQTLNLELKVASTVQQINVQENTGPSVSTDSANNATALILRGDDLQALADDPEDLQADLEALAGPSAGPNGGSIFVDGFSGGEIPPKETIREIRINQNPFSPEYDKLGYGRIEIFTKPGSDKYRASLNFNHATDALNSRNPYSAQKATLQLNEFENDISGPLGKRASFDLEANQNSVDNGSIVNAVTLDPQTLTPSPFFGNLTAVQRRTRITPRIDYALSDKNTLTFRYGFTRGDIQNAGVGGFNLASQGYHTHYLTETAQLTDTAVLGTAINEIRFQYYRNALQNIANTPGVAIRVLGSFNTGGSTIGRSADTQNHFEFQNYTTMAHGAHVWKFGVRIHAPTDDNVSPQNFNGAFTFTGGIVPALDANNQLVLDASGNPVLAQISSIERYRRTLLFQQLGLSSTQIAARGGGATQFIISTGQPELALHQIETGIFAGDDWRVRPNLTLNLGLRYETQTNIHDARDFAPRVGLAWAPGGSAKQLHPKTVLRAGFGMFYDRFGLANSLTAARYNGVVQKQYVVTNPAFFPNLPPLASLGGFQSTQVVQEVSSSLRAPYLMQSAFTLERQLPANTTMAVTYTASRGVHMLRSEDINAPFPGTGAFPLGSAGPVFLMESAGVYNQNQIIANFNAKLTASVSLAGSYTFNRASSNTDGLGTFPANPYSYAGEYGPASTDIRHRVSINGTINTKWNVRVSPLVSLQSGPPFDITSGSDVYGTTLFNARPGIAADPTRPGLIQTRYGLLDPNPSPGEKVLPRNFGRGPGQRNVNLRVAKIFGFGAEKEGGKGPGGGLAGVFTAPPERRYTLSISMSIRNLLNHTNPGPIIGNITSPLFGQANQMFGNINGEGFSENANNRRMELQTRFTF